ncbi:MAG: glycosyl hydrolase family 95 catalytic domain-containing protein [Oliverpabstia sp.]
MNRLIDNYPAEKWKEAFPIGNGRVGAMIFGNTGKERVQLNEDSVWYGRFRDRVNPDARRSLPKIRKMILDGDIQQAQELLMYSFSGTPESQNPYQTAGNLWIDWKDQGRRIENYIRYLDMDQGLVKVCYLENGYCRKCEYLASFPEQLLAIKVTTDHPDGFSCDLRLERGKYYDHSGKVNECTIFMDGNMGGQGSYFFAAACAQTFGDTGEVTVLGDHLLVRNAKEMVIYIAIETSFYQGKEAEHIACLRMEQAIQKGYEKIREEHIADYKTLFDRVEFHLEQEEQDTTIRELLLSCHEDYCGEKAEEKRRKMAELYFQYGRYLTIAGSRPGSQAATLQGIWNEEMTPCWESKYTININTEMNYWPTDVCNLSECYLPFFELIKRMYQHGKDVAEKMYGCRGFVAHHNTDLWGDCAPQDIWIPSTYWVLGAAWMCTHIWNHYLYTKDSKFLQEMFPILEDAVLFLEDFMIKDGEWMILCPSVSPENQYYLPDGTCGTICKGASMDSQIIRELIQGYLKSCETLGIHNEIQNKADKLLGQLPPICIGRYGQIMEWMEDYEEPEPGHRHISQLFALYPAHQITVDDTPELTRAAEKTLERRLSHGGGHTGWSCAWIVNFYAQLRNSENAWKYLLQLWSRSTFPNLMDGHPMGDGAVFQIDGNMGGTAAIAEMLVQSRENVILLLPALPKEWPDGLIRGLKLSGNGEISVQWKKGKLEFCTLLFHGEEEHTVKIQYDGKEKYLEMPGRKKVIIKNTYFE